MTTTDAAALVAATLTDGGSTTWTRPDLAASAPTTGFVVGDGTRGFHLPIDMFEEIGASVLAGLTPWAARQNYDGFGTWVHEGRVYIDPVTFHDDLDAALIVARRRGEIAIFDIAAAEAVNVDAVQAA